MKTMLLDDGDLVIGTSSDYQMVTAEQKVKQDVRGALLEPLGNDRFHPGWGSTLFDHIGEPLTEFNRTAVLSEVNRVVGNYAAIQRDRVEADMLSNTPTRFSTNEIVTSVIGVRAEQVLDSMRIEIGIGTVARTSVDIDEVL